MFTNEMSKSEQGALASQDRDNDLLAYILVWLHRAFARRQPLFARNHCRDPRERREDKDQLAESTKIVTRKSMVLFSGAVSVCSMV
jgi:hypothetical protein